MSLLQTLMSLTKRVLKLKSGIKLIYGVGINDSDYPLSINEPNGYKPNGQIKFKCVWVCPFYSRWKEVLRRCYSENFKRRKPSYTDCNIHPDWLRFSVFKAWMEQQDWEGNQIDKDLLFPGNKEYGPDTCVFVHPLINQFIVGSTTDSEHLVGVLYRKDINKFMARCRGLDGKHANLGVFKTEQEASHAYLSFKYKKALMLTELTSNPVVKEALIRNYYYEN